MTGEWFELDDVESYQDTAWQNRVDGRVLSLEPVGDTTYNVVVLPENYKDDNQVIRVVGEYTAREKAIDGVQLAMAGVA